MADCVFRIDETGQLLKGYSEFKAFLASGGLEQLYPDGSYPWLPKVNNETLPPEKAMQLKEAHKAFGRDVKKSSIENQIAILKKEISTGKTNNGGVLVNLRPKTINQRKEQLSRLKDDLALFDSSSELRGDNYVKEKDAENNLPNSRAATAANAGRGDSAVQPTRVVNEKTSTVKIGVTEVNSPEDALHIVESFSNRAGEQMLAIVLDDNKKVLQVIRHTSGLIDSSMVDVGVLAGSIHDVPKARYVYFAHNHPSGITDQSQSDINITDKLTDFLRGTGITAKGMLVIGQNGEGSFYDENSRGRKSHEITATKAERTKSIPVTERIIERHGRAMDDNVKSQRQAVDIAKEMSGGKSGIILLDNQNYPVSFVPMTLADMARLRSNKGSGSSLLSKEIHKSNARAMLAYAPSKSEVAGQVSLFDDGVISEIKPSDDIIVEAAKNLSRFANNSGNTRLLDFVVGKTTLQSSYVDYSVQNSEVYFSRAADKDDIDNQYFAAINSGDMESVQRLVNEQANKKGYQNNKDYRMDHRAPGFDDTPLDERVDDGGDFSIEDIANGYSSQPDDYFDSRVGARYYGYDNYVGRQSQRAVIGAIDKIKKGEKATVTIYRAVPKTLKESKTRNGDWVTLSEEYAKDHGKHVLGFGQYRVISEQVPAEHVWWDGNDINEWGYDDGKDYVYSNTKNNKKTARAIVYDDNGEIIPLSKRFNKNNADTRFSFAGQNAKTADKYQLANAQSRLENGEDAEQVRKDTGWFMGVDGKWRFEIDDSDAELINRPIYNQSLLFEDVISHPALFEAYPSAGRVRVRTNYNKKASYDAAYFGSENYPVIEIYNDSLSDEKLLSIMLHEIQHHIQDGEENFATGGNAESARDVLDSLVKEMRRIKLAPSDRINNYYRSAKIVSRIIDARRGISSFDIWDRNPESIRKYSEWYLFGKGLPRKKGDERTDILNGVIHEAKQHWIKRFNDIGVFNEVQLREYVDNKDRSAELRVEGKVIRAFDKEFPNFKQKLYQQNKKADDMESSAKYQSNYKLYMRLAGEIEARNTQARAGLTEAERKATPPSATQDIPDSDAIVVWNGQEMHSVPANAAQTVAPTYTKNGLIEAIRTSLDSLFSKGWTDRLFATGKFKVVSSDEAGAIVGDGALFSKPINPQYSLTSATDSLGNLFETGVPVTFNYAHNTESATKLFGKPKKDSKFGRYFEPSGEYVTDIGKGISDENKRENMEYGTITLNNPLVIDNDSLNWKEQLSKSFGGKRGKNLSIAVINAGYDGIVTVDNGHTSEIVNLQTFDESKAKFSKSGKILAFYNPKDKTTYFVHDNIDKDTNLFGLMLHEIAVHALRLGRDSEEFNSILGKFEALRNNPKVKVAFARVPESTKPANVIEEALAYFLEHNPYHALTQRFMVWLKKAIRAISKTLGLSDRLKFNQWANSLNEADLRDMAISALRGAPESLLDESNLAGGDDVLVSAQKAGYEGNDKGEAEEWLRAKAKGLDMSYEARMARAKDMGFDVDKVWYHGRVTNDIVNNVIPLARRGSSVGAYYLTNSKKVATAYAKTSTPKNNKKNIEDAKLIDGYSPNVTEIITNIRNPITDNTTIFDLFDTDELISALSTDNSELDYAEFWDEEEKQDAIENVLDNTGPEYTSASMNDNLSKIFGFLEQYPSFYDELKENYDGVIYSDNEAGGITLVPFKDNSIRSINAAFDPDYADSPNLLASAPVDRFYSALRRAFLAAPDKVFQGNSGQVKLWINNNLSKFDVKKDEVYWSGLNDWLDTKTKVSRDDVVRFVSDNGVKVEDVVLGDATSKYEKARLAFNEHLDNLRQQGLTREDIAKDSEYHRLMKLRDLADEAQQEVLEPKHNTEQLTLPDGKDYHELIVTVPSVESWNRDDSTHFGSVGKPSQQDIESFKKQKNNINQSVDDDFLGIIDRMKHAGVLEVDCG